MKKYISYLIILILITTFEGYAQNKLPQIIVGPNIQISQDGNFSKAEMMLATNPTNPENMILGSSTFPFRYESGRLDKIYFTKDGGKTWDDTVIPEAIQYGGADPQVAFGIHGEAFFADILFPTIANTTKTAQRLYFSRSEDGGKTWLKAINLEDNILYGSPMGQDHEQIVVDQTFGKFAGRIYLSSYALASIKDNALKYTLSLFRSDDNGKSFIGPLKLFENYAPIHSTNLLISSKGKFYCTYLYDDRVNAKVKTCFISSEDGGASFSSLKQISETHGSVMGSGAFPQFAIDSKSKKYLDRLYQVFSKEIPEDKISRLAVSYSKDEGETWSEPKFIDMNCPGNTKQYQPSIAVNSAGVVGVKWYDAGGVGGNKGINQYFTASLDGGETFLPSVKISDSTSKVPNYNDDEILPIWKRTLNKDAFIISFFNNIEMREWLPHAEGGGDYTQFTVDAKGIFHSIWSDIRDRRSFQIYTSAIEVIAPDDSLKGSLIAQPEIIRVKYINTPVKNKMLKQIASNISLRFEDASYDTLTNLLSIPIHLKNISDKPIYGPIKLVISNTNPSDKKQEAPIMLEYSNKPTGNGVSSTLTLKNIGESNTLLPGRETGAVIWKATVKIPKKINPLNEIRKQAYNTNKDYQIEWLCKTISDAHVNVIGYVEK